MRLLLVVLALLLPGTAAPAASPCGTRPNDWCPAEPGDTCGRHGSVEACRADKACYGMPYSGESLVACKRDDRGFGLNCPTVGCTGKAPANR